MTTIGARPRYKAVPFRGEAARLLAAALLALSAGACSMSFPITSLVDEPTTTSSVKPRAISPLSPDLGEEDWRRAKAALAVALDPHGSGAQVSWDNPDTKLKGTFKPTGQLFVKDDQICRVFHATIVGQGASSSLQGTGCRPSGGEWAVKDVKPAKA